MGPLERYAEGFVGELSRIGYTRGSMRDRLLLMADLSCWLHEERLDPGALTPSRVKEFFVVRRAAGYSMYRSPGALVPLLDYLESVGVVVMCVVAEPTPIDLLVERYRNYLIGERGLALSTVRIYVRAIRPLLAGCLVGDRLNVGELTAGDVTGFMLEVARKQQPGNAQTTASALRSLLRFLHVKGLVASSLVGAVPSVASWRVAPLPRGLEPDEVKRLLATCDRRTTAGRRDFAILLLLVRLGLRAGEVAGLRLDDINWRVGEIVVSGKGDRRRRLLGHRRVLTTAIYAKVDRAALRELARPWPGGTP